MLVEIPLLYIAIIQRAIHPFLNRIGGLNPSLKIIVFKMMRFLIFSGASFNSSQVHNPSASCKTWSHDAMLRNDIRFSNL